MLRTSRRLLRLFPLALLLALSSCAGRLLSRAREAERVGAHYEAERLYKELYKSTPTKERQRRALYSLRAAEAPTEADAMPRQGLYCSALSACTSPTVYCEKASYTRPYPQKRSKQKTALHKGCMRWSASIVFAPHGVSSG